LNKPAFSLRCVECDSTWPGLEVRYRCDCGGTLEVVFEAKRVVPTWSELDTRRSSRFRLDRSGVWRFRELVLPIESKHVVSKPEGNTNLYEHPNVARYVGLDRLLLKHEGENPTGSFKDRGMTVGISVARALGFQRVACASTGNTSASMAAYAAAAGMTAYVFVPAGQIAYGKLSQSLAYGARTLQLEGSFDEAMQLVQELCLREGIYLLNSINPFRIEGQKAIGFELIQDLGWRAPDWIVLPGGNLGNVSALAKGLIELRSCGLLSELPRIAVVQAAGAAPLATAWKAGDPEIVPVEAQTLATAIRIGRPVSARKAWRALTETHGVALAVTDQQILDAKAVVDRAGIGAEPASCAAVAGIKDLVTQGVIAKNASVVAILTGHMLKDPDTIVKYHQGKLPGIESTEANAPTTVAPTMEAILAALKE
jgi:threonine synthase